MRVRRTELAKDKEIVSNVLSSGIERARAVAVETLNEVRQVMNMNF
jgi:hypothetical protein